MGLVDLVALDIDTPESIPDLGIYRLGLHVIQICFAFLTFCIIIPVISIQGHYHGSSLAAPNYTLAVTLVSISVSVALALFPLVKYRTCLIPVRNFFLRPRTALIFTCFLTFGWFAAMISMTAHANNDENCTLNSRLQKNDRSYAGSWMKQCNSAKAAAAFSWLSFFVWLATAVCNSILFWHEKKVSHEESRVAAAAAVARNLESDSSYDEDARTIVNIELSDKEKKFDSMSSTSSSHQHDKNTASSSPANVAHPLPAAPPVYKNDFSFTSLPMNPHPVPSYDTPRTTPTNLVSSYNPHSNISSPYSVNAPVTSPSPYYTQPQSPYATTAYQQPYHHSPAPYNIPAEQQSYSPSLYRDPSLVYHQPSQRSYHSGQTYPYN
ncbi:hypothetical protein HPULCUR_004684 [Helicostylum pulchrum]|uniref:MARVEL domain-containing protein n=1 Tax=Helicostylum pulchrum TaxID=562976 RepID=A0ABP9XWX1_9FUNG